MLNFENLIALSTKPPLYQKGNAVMWTDPHISKQLLNIHLDPEIDLASRKKTTVAQTVQWVEETVEKKHLNILDLGCGPGLYTQRFAKNGHRVTGIDFSDNSISYAKNDAKKKELAIEYRQMNYLELDEHEKYDLALMIFTDFGVLNPDERKKLLANVYQALKPGGCFIFDVLNDDDMDGKLSPNFWEGTDKGFWRDSPYLLLSNTFEYAKEKIILFQHGVMDKEGLSIYRFWTHFFSDADLKVILDANGFENHRFFKDIIPGDGVGGEKDVTFCMTRKA